MGIIVFSILFIFTLLPPVFIMVLMQSSHGGLVLICLVLVQEKPRVTRRIRKCPREAFGQVEACECLVKG